MRRRSWLGRLFGPDGEEEAPPPPPPASRIEEPALPAEPDVALTDLYSLAEQLAGLIATARERLDGAVNLVDRSANEAAAYGQALAHDANAIDAAGLPVEVITGLLDLTRTMITRTAACESRLRATNSELRGLQADLHTAQEIAERDALTGLPNRRALELALRSAIATAEATDSALSVAYCDIDHFKRLNDIHGHGVGDRVLRLVADSLVDGLGDVGTVGRQGGEEFVVLFEGLPVIEAAARVDAVRETLANRSLRSRSDGTPLGTVTFSAGVAGLTSAETEEQLVERADRALYRAKNNGRNQVVIDAGD